MTTASVAGMRNTRPRQTRRINVWFEARVSELSFLVFLVLLCALTFKGFSLFRKPLPQPVAIVIAGQMTNDSGDILTQVMITNTSKHWFSYAFSTQVLTNGSWQNGAVQHRDAASAIALPPKSGRLYSLPTPQEGDEWRASLVAQRIMGEVETEVSGLCRRFNFEYPFAKELHVRGPEMLNLPCNLSTTPQLAAKKMTAALRAERESN